MTIHLHDERRLPLEPEALVRLLKDPAFQLARSAHLGTLEARCTVEDDVVRLEETRDTGWKPHLYVTRLTTRWRGTAARWTLERLSGPGDARASGRLVAHPVEGGCNLVMEGTLEVRVPVFGGLIERLARRALTAEKAREARFVSTWIAR